MQRICGTKQIWEVLAFTGRFDADILGKTMEENADRQQDVPEEIQEEHLEQRRLLQREKVEAKARYNEALRLARRRDAHLDRRKDAPSFNSSQQRLLQLFDSGHLLRDCNSSIVAWGHGRLRSRDGRTMDIGGSTGGGSRRVIDDWVEPNCEEFLTQSDTNPELLPSMD